MLSKEPPQKNHADGNGELFVILLANGQILKASEFTITSLPEIEKITAQPGVRRLTERSKGVRVLAGLACPDEMLEAQWAAELQDGSNYIVQRVTVMPKNADVPGGAIRRRLPREVNRLRFRPNLDVRKGKRRLAGRKP